MAKRRTFNTSKETPENQRELANKKHGNTKIFHLQDLSVLQPLTLKQQEFVKAYKKGIKTIIQVGDAGCGKTALALSCALEELLNEKSVYKKIIIIRSAVETRKIGFLPGDVDEKTEPFTKPYVDACSVIIPKYADAFAHLMSQGLIEFRLTTHLRGDNFTDAIVIVDEIQNFDFSELETTYTRIKSSTRIIMCGDEQQNDLSRYREVSGLSKFLTIFKHIDKYKDIIEDRSNMLHDTVDKSYYNMFNNLYKVIRYEAIDCVRDPYVRAYLITKSQLIKDGILKPD